MSENRPRDEAELSELLASIDVTAPRALHARVGMMIDEAGAPARAGSQRRPPALRLGAALAALGAVVLVLVVGLTGGPAKLGLDQTAALALASPTMTAPAENPAVRGQLNVAVDGIAFPYWEERFGWRASGAGTAQREGRTIRTVFYSDQAGHTVGYAIVAGSPPPVTETGTIHTIRGTSYRLTSYKGAGVVSWLRDGHLCVVAGQGIPATTLLALAGWQ